MRTTKKTKADSGGVEELREAIDFVETHHPLPRCAHGQALKDHAGELLEPSCGCRATMAKREPLRIYCSLCQRELFKPHERYEQKCGFCATHKPKRKLGPSDIATILAALRLFQREYEGVSAEDIRDQWDHFADTKANKFSEPLGTDDISALCEEINCGMVEL